MSAAGPAGAGDGPPAGAEGDRPQGHDDLERPLGRICVFGTFDAGRHPRAAIIAEGLRDAGAEVVVCNVPWDAPTHLRVAALRRPWLLLVLLQRLVRAWGGLRRAARRVGDVEVVVVGYLGVFDVHLARRLWPDATLVLDHLAPVGGTVADRGAGRGVRARLAQLVDRRAVACADLVVVDTPEHLPRARGVVVPVGAPTAWFDVRDREAARPGGVDAAAGGGGSPLRVVFFGLYTPLQGAATIATGLAEAIDRGLDLHVTLIGDGQDRDAAQRALAGRPGVTWFDWVEPASLPSIVASHDVCLGILGTTPKAARVVPNKVFQGAAAGCAVVTSDTQPQRRALGDAAVYVPVGSVAESAAALAATLARFADDADALRSARDRAATRADHAFRPAAVVEPLLAALDAGR